jgi:hypothetical protein
MLKLKMKDGELLWRWLIIKNNSTHIHTYITTYEAVGGFGQLKVYGITKLAVVILCPPTDGATGEKPTCWFPAFL